ncbi:hypothetical protein NA57DRAFT_79811 [Rhizodiscina lignyota]|uniref:Uncharacterized protein n=1 Tax=Rhizodiscina lignyota TaxID=1504668 RepID=A0A9P4M252_9PEZI|nr:hypothetical protein NA57DRAFT_79811 [Rhizodiscina lignyota]
MVHITSSRTCVPLLLLSLLQCASARPSHFYLLPRQANQSLAAASASTGDLTADSSCKDLSDYQFNNKLQLQADFWDKTDTSDMLKDWCDGTSACGSNFASAFADPWGMGQSFSCSMNVPCGRPDCSNMQDDTAPKSGAAYEVMVSLSNVNQYLVNLRAALNQGKDRFNGLSTALQQTFWPSHNPDNLLLGEIMNGGQAAMGMIAAIAGGPMAGIAKELVNGMLNGVYRAMTGKDESLQNLASMEQETDEWYQGCLNSVNTLNDDLMTLGSHDGMSVQDLLADGTWLDYRDHPILNTDASRPLVQEGQLNDLMYHFLLGQLINYSWKQQSTWLVTYPMSEDDFNSRTWNAGSNDGRLKMYYGGTAWFFQSLYMDGNIPTAQNPPGWDKVEDNMGDGFDAHSIIVSSADGFSDSGFDHDFNTNFDQFFSEPDTTTWLSVGPRARGYFSIPVCNLAGSDNVGSLDELNDWLDSPGDWFADGRAKSSYCACKDTTDQTGKLFSDAFPSDMGLQLTGNCDPTETLPPGP